MNRLLLSLTLFGIVLCQTGDAQLIQQWYTNTQHGEGTYYGPTTGGMCASISNPTVTWIDNTQIGGGSLSTPISAAMNAPMIYNSLTCGTCVEITGEGLGLGANPITGPITALIADVCPGCASGDIDFGNSGDGRWNISWKAIPCPITGTALIVQEDATNSFYLKFQVRNTPYPVQFAFVKQSTGATLNMTRESYNFFILNTQLFYPLTLTLTDIWGSQIMYNLTSVGSTANMVYEASTNFPVQSTSSTTGSTTASTTGSTTGTTTASTTGSTTGTTTASTTGSTTGSTSTTGTTTGSTTGSATSTTGSTTGSETSTTGSTTGSGTTTTGSTSTTGSSSVDHPCFSFTKKRCLRNEKCKWVRKQKSCELNCESLSLTRCEFFSPFCSVRNNVCKKNKN